MYDLRQIIWYSSVLKFYDSMRNFDKQKRKQSYLKTAFIAFFSQTTDLVNLFWYSHNLDGTQTTNYWTQDSQTKRKIKHISLVSNVIQTHQNSEPVTILYKYFMQNKHLIHKSITMMKNCTTFSSSFIIEFIETTNPWALLQQGQVKAELLSRAQQKNQHDTDLRE